MTTGEIPQSAALAEADPDSLSELMSRDPEGYQRQDLDAIIAALRAQRERWQKAEAEGTTRSKATRVSAAVTKSASSAGDLGL